MNKKNNIDSKIIDSWECFDNFFEKEKEKEKWIYRGQCNYPKENGKPELQTSLERLCDSLKTESKNDHLKNAHIIEKNIVTEFKRRFHQYSNYVPDRKDNIEWLSIMRHHMAPTRLLDWNFSPYIALYFALHKSNKDSYVVWCIKSEWARHESIEKFTNNTEYYKDDFEKSSYGLKPDLLTNVLLKNSFRTVFPISPRFINERLTVQKGLFMCPGDPTCTFEDNLKEMPNYEENIKKLIIPEKCRIEFLKKLHTLNISHATLFPDLDGFANSLSVYHQSYIMDFKGSNHNNNDSAWE